MTSDVEPIIDQPALRVKAGSETSVVVADLHLGVEHAIAEAGVRIPGRTWTIQERLIGLCSREKADKLLILGDVKHSVPGTSWQEKQELPEFFRGIQRQVGRVEIAVGNHDTYLRELLPGEIVFHEPDGFSYNGIGFVHGHMWPSKETVDNEVIVLAHNHPTITLVDELGVSHNYPCWVRGTAVPDKMKERYGDGLRTAVPEVIMIPSFLEFGSGTVVNEKDQRLLGPFLNNGFLDLMRSKVFLLDGTLLGFVESLILD